MVLMYSFLTFFFYLHGFVKKKMIEGDSCSCLLNTCFLLNTGLFNLHSGVENMEECGTYRPLCSLLSSLIVSNTAKSNRVV